MNIFIAFLSGLTESNTVFARYGEFESGPEGHTHPAPKAAGPAQPVSIVEGGKKKVKKPRSEKRKQQSLKSFQQRAKEVYLFLNPFLELLLLFRWLFSSFMQVKVIPIFCKPAPTLDVCNVQSTGLDLDNLNKSINLRWIHCGYNQYGATRDISLSTKKSIINNPNYNQHN